MIKKTLCYHIENIVDKYKHKTAVIYKKDFRTEKWTYQELYDYIHRIASYFEDMGFKKGDKILIYANNSPDWSAIFFSSAITGIIAVPIDYNSNIDYAKKIYHEVDAKIVFSSKYKPFNDIKYKEIQVEELRDIVEQYPKYQCSANIKDDDILEIVYTSGTTGEPKGVIVTNRNVVSDILSLTKVVPFEHNLVLLSIIPLSHMLEQVLGLLVPLYFGCTIVYVGSRKSSTILNAFNDEKITTMVTVPIFLETLKDAIELEMEKRQKQVFNRLKNYNLPIFIRRLLFRKIIRRMGGKLRFFVVGGAPLNKPIEEFWNSIGILILQGYGLTETTSVLTCNTFNFHKTGSVGMVTPEVKLKIAEDGEILCKGENVTRGYFKNKKATSQAIKDGWLHTGDIGKFDQDHFLKIIGRKKNMIVSSSGMKVYPEDIESIINQKDCIKDSCVIGLKEKDVVITAVILTKKDVKINSDFLREINSRLSPHQHVQKLITWENEDFPRTSSLKIKRNVIEEIISKKIKQSQPSTKNKLYALLSKLSNTELSKITPDSVLSTELAIDSLYRVELVSIIEEQYHVEIDESSINENTTVKDIEKLIKKGSQISRILKLSYWNTSRLLIYLRFLSQSILFFVMKFFLPLTITGKKNLGTTWPVILIGNHTSHLDTPTLLRTLPINLRTKVAFAAAEDYFFDSNSLKKFRLFVIRLFFNIYPFSRHRNLKRNLQLTGKMIDKGYSIVVFPEGTRSTTGKINEFKSGIGMMASKMEVPIIPFRTEGLFEILPKGAILPKLGKTKITLGKPYFPNKTDSYITIVNDLEAIVRQL